jgi:nucleotidyltransferase/DNA polymerase involved in DNA repair
VDEAFVGLGPEAPTLEKASEVARAIQGEIDRRFGLGASIGIGPNKLVAKMASGVEKPRGLVALDQEGFRGVFWPRDIQTMWGVGPKLAERMRSLGIKTVGELARAPDHVPKAAFGIIGPQLREAAWGEDDTPLVPYHRGVEAKSMGHEVTLSEDCDEPAALEGTLLRLSDQVARRLREGYVGAVTLKLRDHRFVTVPPALRFPTTPPSGSSPPRARCTRTGKERCTSRGQRFLSRRCAGASCLRGSRSRLAGADRVRDRLGKASVVPLPARSAIAAQAPAPGGLATKAPAQAAT